MKNIILIIASFVVGVLILTIHHNVCGQLCVDSPICHRGVFVIAPLFGIGLILLSISFAIISFVKWWRWKNESIKQEKEKEK